jgi:predicted nucleotidyltransferase
VLAYFDYFKFPLTLAEVHKFIGLKCNVPFLESELEKLVQSEAIFKISDCYLLPNDADKVERKKRGFQNAEKRMVKARKISKLIMWFPFVRMASISGSLSKGYSDENSDIDFFIVTTKNQMWTARTLLHLFKKFTFLVGQQHSFCMNYFLAEGHLALEEKNYFTAVELSTLIAVCGKQKQQMFLKENRWIEDYLPNFKVDGLLISENDRSPKGGKWLLEKLLYSTKLNSYFLGLTDRKWRKKWKKKGYPAEDYDLAFKTTMYESKNHPGNNQKKLLTYVKDKNWKK